MNNIGKNLVLFSLIGIISACATSGPKLQLGPDAKTSPEGLHFVDNTVMDEVWFQPTADLSQYSRILIVGSGFHYAEPGNSEPSKKVLQQRERFEQLVKAEFKRELKQLKGYEIVNEHGPDVLLLHMAMTNVKLTDFNLTSAVKVYAGDLGSAVLVLDLRDSVSGAPIALATDRQALKKSGQEFSRVTDLDMWQATSRVARGWAKLARSNLELLANYDFNRY